MSRRTEMPSPDEMAKQQRIVLDLIALQDKTPAQFAAMNAEAKTLMAMTRALEAWRREQALAAARRSLRPPTPCSAPIRRKTPVQHQSVPDQVITRLREMRSRQDLTPVQLSHALRYVEEHPDEVDGYRCSGLSLEVITDLVIRLGVQAYARPSRIGPYLKRKA